VVQTARLLDRRSVKPPLRKSRFFVATAVQFATRSAVGVETVITQLSKINADNAYNARSSALNRFQLSNIATEVTQLRSQ